MSYRLDLDEYDEAVLRNELIRRSGARARGFCDYCGRHPFTKPCKEPHRHRDVSIKSAPEYACNGVFRKMADYSLPPAQRWSKGGIVADHTECNICHTHAPLDHEDRHHDAILTEPVG